MNTTSTTYRDYLQHIVDNGRIKSDRTGTGTMSVFGYQLRYDLAEGFPLETLKFTAFRLIKEELLWFIRGSTNALELIDLNCHIWDEWMVQEDAFNYIPLTESERILIFAGSRMSMREARALVYAETINASSSANDAAECRAKYLDSQNVPRTRAELRTAKGELGPVYGAQWRSWPNYKGGSIDQLKEAIELLRTKPNSRRIIVSAWNPADLPDESIKPHENAAEGRMALAACHTMFQFMAEPLTLIEREDLVLNDYEKWGSEYHSFVDDNVRKGPVFDEAKLEWMNERGVPLYRLSCQLYQRSADSTLGVPFNIASYALLTHMVAQCVNMVPGDFVHTFGDAHIYLNHFEEGGILEDLGAPAGRRTPKGEGVETLLQRTPLAFPTLKLNPAIREIDDFTSADIEIVNYKHQGKMTFPVAV